jgi:hypothetical protein
MMCTGSKYVKIIPTNLIVVQENILYVVMEKGDTDLSSLLKVNRINMVFMALPEFFVWLNILTN